MTTLETQLALGLVPPDEALPRIRDLLAAEAEAERNGGEREDDLAVLCCVQLFGRGQLEDVLRIWAAKRAGMDLGVSIDIQFLCGAGLSATKAFLASKPGAAAAAALKHLTACEAAGDFKGFSREGHLDHYRRYFGVE